MNRFEDELRSALQRREPPEGFTQRVMARIPQYRERPGWLRSLWTRGFPPSWAPATAVVLMAALGAGSWEYYRVRERRHQAEQAKAELIYALELTSAKLQSTRSKLQR